jgi:hypothetical protein
MAEAIAERVKRYILDGSDEDLRRLLGIAETTREMARSAFRRVGSPPGSRSTIWRVIFVPRRIAAASGCQCRSSWT